jgi:hypothetical protein
MVHMETRRIVREVIPALDGAFQRARNEVQEAVVGEPPSRSSLRSQIDVCPARG